VYAPSRAAADESGGVYTKAKYPGQIMVWLGACYTGLTKAIIFEPHETLTQDNYINDVLPLALSEGKRLIGDIFRVVSLNSAGKKNIFSISFITRVIYIVEKLFLLSGKEQTFLYRLV
jgi:hypothetical protein